MSDNWIALIPEDPTFVPDPVKQSRARDRFAEIAPDADKIEIKVCDKVAFFDCGANFERILCPSCRADIPIIWRQDRMDEDYHNGFMPSEYPMPCCNAPHTLHELIYYWPQGFGRFAIDAMNPNIGELDPRFKKELEDILGTELRVVYQHL